MSTKHNASHQSALDQIEDPSIKQAVADAMLAEEQEDDEEPVEDADDYTTFVAKSEESRDKAVARWEVRAQKGLVLRRAKIVAGREGRHQTRCAEWALKHQGAINPGNAALLEDVLDKQIAAAEALIAERKAKLVQLRAMTTQVEQATEEIVTELEASVPSEEVAA